MTNQAVKYDVTDAALKKLEKKYSTVPDVTTKEGYQTTREGIAEIRTLRCNVEKKRKELKAEALEYGRKVDSEAKRITTVLSSLEEPLKIAKAEIDDAKEKAKEAKRRAEEERRAGILLKIEDIRRVLLGAVNKSSSAIIGEIELVNKIEVTQGIFEEYLDLGETAKAETLATLHELHQKALEREDAAKLRALEEKKLKAEQEKLEIEKEKLRLEREEVEQRERKAEEEKQKKEKEEEKRRLEQARAEQRKEKEKANIELQQARRGAAFDAIKGIIQDIHATETLLDAIVARNIPYITFNSEEPWER